MSKETLKEALVKAKEMLTNAETDAQVKDLVTITGWKDALRTFPLLFLLAKKVIFAVDSVLDDVEEAGEEETIAVSAQLLDDLIKFSGWASPLEMVDGALFQILIRSAYEALKDKFGVVAGFFNVTEISAV